MTGFTFDIEAVDAASRAIEDTRSAIRDLAGESGELVDRTDDATESTENATRALENQASSAGSVIDGLGRIGMAAQGLRAIYGTLTSTLGESVQGHLSHVQVTQDLEFALRRSGVEAEDLAESVAKIRAEMNVAQDRTIFDDEDQMEAMARILRMTGDLSTAEEDLARARDLATAANQSLAQTSTAIARARTGDFAQMRRLGIMNADEIRDLNQIESASERAARGFEILADRVGGFAEEVDPALQKTARLENDLGDLNRSAGAVVFGLLEAGSAMVLPADDASSGIQRLASRFDELAESVDYARKGVEAYRLAGELADEQYTTRWAQVRDGVRMMVARDLWEEGREEAEEYRDTVLDLQTQLANRRAGMTSEMAEELRASQEAAEALKQELIETTEWIEMGQFQTQAADLGLSEEQTAAALANQRRIREEMAVAREEERAAREQAAAEENAQATEAARRARERRAAAAQATTLIQADLAALQETDAVRRAERELERDILRIRQSGLEANEEEMRIALARERTAQRIEDLESRRAEDARAAADATAVLQGQLSVAMARTEETRAQRELELELLRIQQAGLAGEDERLRVQLAQIQHAETLTRLEEARAVAEERRIRELHRAEMETFREKLSAQEAIFRQLEDSFRNVGDGLGPAAARMAGQVGAITTQFQEMQQQGGTAIEALSGSAAAGGNAVAGFLEAMGLGYREVAGVRATFEGAAAIAAYASGNIPGGVGHTAAAVAFGAMAGGAGGGGASADAGAAATSAPTQRLETTLDGAIAAQKQAYLEALRAHDADRPRAQTIIDSRGSYYLDRSPSARREIQATLSGDRRLRLDS